MKLAEQNEAQHSITIDQVMIIVHDSLKMLMLCHSPGSLSLLEAQTFIHIFKDKKNVKFTLVPLTFVLSKGDD